MKLKIALLSTMLFCGYASMGQKPDARTILLKSAEVLKQKELFQYEAQYRIKYFDNSDTTPLSTYKCVLLKAPADTVLNHYARVYNQDEDKIYDGYNFLLIWHGQKKILKDNPLVSGKNFTRNNIKRDFLPNFLYSPTPFKGYLADATEMKVSATVLNGLKAWKIDISLPTDEEITLLKRVVYINQRNYYPMKVEGFAKFQNIQDEYYSLVINNLICSDSAEDDFTKYYQYPENYAEESFKAPKINYDLLPPGTAFIPVEGLSLDGKEQNLNEEFSKDKLILLDFWYLACANCLRAMPHLSTLASTYKDRGLLVYGFESYDDPNTKREVAKKFIDKFKVEYPQVFINKSLAEQYQIKIYPSMYLIKNGKVVYAHIGYSETQIKELEQVIQEQLSK